MLHYYHITDPCSLQHFTCTPPIRTQLCLRLPRPSSRMQCLKRPFRASPIERAFCRCSFFHLKRQQSSVASKHLFHFTTRTTLPALLSMAPKQSTLGYVKPSQTTLR